MQARTPAAKTPVVAAKCSGASPIGDVTDLLAGGSVAPRLPFARFGGVEVPIGGGAGGAVAAGWSAAAGAAGWNGAVAPGAVAPFPGFGVSAPTGWGADARATPSIQQLPC